MGSLRLRLLRTAHPPHSAWKRAERLSRADKRRYLSSSERISSRNEFSQRPDWSFNLWNLSPSQRSFGWSNYGWRSQWRSFIEWAMIMMKGRRLATSLCRVGQPSRRMVCSKSIRKTWSHSDDRRHLWFWSLLAFRSVWMGTILVGKRATLIDKLIEQSQLSTRFSFHQIWTRQSGANTSASFWTKAAH